MISRSVSSTPTIPPLGEPGLISLAVSGCHSAHANDVLHPLPVTKGKIRPDSLFQTPGASDEYPIARLEALDLTLYPF
jgi:hypothetical protein